MDKAQVPENIISEVADRISSRFGMRLDSFIVMKNISNSIAARMDLLDLESPDEYLQSKIRSPLLGDTELKALFDIISVNETFFFRTPEHFRALENHVVPKILDVKRRAGDNSFSIWSAGCSTGEEPYTTAIVCNEMARLHGTLLSILGSDQDGDAVTRATAAVFSQRSVQKAPPRLLERYWEKQGNLFQLKDEIKSMVRFEKHNLNNKYPGDPFDRKWDVIFCRNVLIYLKKEAIKTLMKRFHECLNTNGFLVLGPWETQHCPNSLFKTVMKEGIFLFEKKTLSAEKDQKKPATNRKFEKTSSGARGSTTGTHRIIKMESEDVPRKIVEAEGRPGDLPNAARYYENGNRLLASGDIEAAYRELLRAVELDPGMVEAYILLAVILRSRKDLKKAEYYLNKALYLDALCIPALFYMANIHLESGKIEKGIMELEMVKKLLKGKPEIQYGETLGEINRKSILQTCDHLIENRRQK